MDTLRQSWSSASGTGDYLQVIEYVEVWHSQVHLWDSHFGLEDLQVFSLLCHKNIAWKHVMTFPIERIFPVHHHV